MSKYFGGDVINKTEGREVLHTALEKPRIAEVLVDGENVMPEIFEVKRKLKIFLISYFRRIKRIHKSTIYRCCKYWYWWFRFRTSNGCRFL